MQDDLTDVRQIFLDAIKGGDEATVEVLISSHPDLVIMRTEEGLHPAVLAMYHGRRDVADLLVRHGAVLNSFAAATVGRTADLRRAIRDDPSLVEAYSDDGWTLLHLASHFGHPEIVGILLDAGADPEMLARNAQANTSLHAAIAGRQPAIVEILLHGGADPNGKRQDGLTPLRLAVMVGDTAMVRLLLDNGAAPETAAENRQTAVDFARREG